MRGAQEARAAFAVLGPCVIKAQIPAGKRGKSGGIRVASSAGEAEEAAAAILGMTIQGHAVSCVLAEEKAAISKEYYAAVLPDAASRSAMMLFSEEGGMDIEDLAGKKPQAIRRAYIDPFKGFDEAQAVELARGAPHAEALAPVLAKLHGAFRASNSELLEINPLAVLTNGRVVALDCKFTLELAAAYRRPELAEAAIPERLTGLESRPSRPA